MLKPQRRRSTLLLATLALTLGLFLPAPAMATLDASTAEGDCGIGREAPDSFDAAEPIAPPLECSGAIDLGQDQDWYRFTAYTGQHITALVPAAAAGPDVSVCLYKPSGTDAACGFGFPDWDKWAVTTAAESGEWRVVVYGHFGTTGAYGLRLDVHGETPDDPQDDCGTGSGAGNAHSTATFIAPPVDCQGALRGQDVEDWYRFPVREGQTILLNLTVPEGADFDLCLARLNVVACSTNGTGLDEHLEYSQTYTGEWRAKVLSRSGEGSYGLEVDVVGEPVNEQPRLKKISCSPSPVRIGEETTCTFWADDDSSGVAYNFTWGHGQPTIRVPAEGFVTPGEPQSLSHTYDSIGWKSVSFTAVDNADPPRSAGGSRGASLLVRALTPPHDDCGTGGDASDDPMAPTPLVTPVVRCAAALHHEGWADMTDTYSVEMEAGETLTVRATGDHEPTWWGEFEVCLFAPGVEPYTDGAWEFCDFTDSSATATEAGTWRIRIRNWDGHDNYTLSASRRLSEHSGAILIGHVLQGTATIGGTLGPEHGIAPDGAWIELPVVARGGEGATVVTSWGGGVDVAWYDGSGAELGLTAVRTGGDWTPVPAGAERGFVTATLRRGGDSFTLSYLH